MNAASSPWPYGSPAAWNTRGQTPATPKNLTLDGFQFSVKMAVSSLKDDAESRIKTDVVIHEGQKLVLATKVR
jgi:hypothetical protein